MIPLMRNTFIDEDKTKQALVKFILSAKQLSMGGRCLAFEHQFAKYNETNHAVLFNSGASANLALLQSLLNLGRLKRGARIGFSALTWATNVMPIIQLGFTPVPIDCEISTLNVMSNNLRQTLHDVHLDCLFITNALGFAGDLYNIKEICDEHGIIMLEDNCEALGTVMYDDSEAWGMGKLTGTFGLGSTFSFYVAHHMSTIEGGMVCTDDGELAEMLTMVRANGWDRNLTTEQQVAWRAMYEIGDAHQAKYTFYDLAYNLRPTEITGFLGLEQMKYLDDNIAVRKGRYEKFESVAEKNDDIIPRSVAHIGYVSNFAYPVICRSPILKRKYMNRFIDAGVEIRPVISGNIQRQPFWRKYCQQHSVALVNTDIVHDCGFYCGNYPEMTNEEVNTIAGCLK
jgi:CDP-6-deoxy-D-xylo-4-hexulose-3-dehydrase